MRLRSRRSPLLLLLVHSLAVSATLASSPPDKRTDLDAASSSSFDTSAAPVKKYDVGTKDAPVDGKDGRPHSGPWVDVENLRKEVPISGGSKDLPQLKDRPADPTIFEGKKIPESNDGVMDDKNRPDKPKKETTGTSGGVSEKEKLRKAKEDQTGERVENKPEAPKEAPPLPHSEQEKIEDKDGKKGKSKEKEKEKAKDKTKSDGKTSEDVSGLEKPTNLDDKNSQTKPPPVPNSANKNHLEVGKDGSKSSKTGTPSTSQEGNEGLIQPLHSFLLSLTMILFSEVGDKTFLVAALMAMKHDRMVVFSAAFSALITMTVLSAVLGHTVPTLIPKRLTSFLAAGLFFIFGARMLREGMAMSPDEGVTAEMQEVEMELAEKESQARKQGRRRTSSISPYALEMGLGGAGNGRKSRSKTRFPTPPRSPSTSPDGHSQSPVRRGALGAIQGFLAGLNNLFSLLLSPAWVQTFVMTFLGEWGDRSQIATIAMAAGQDYWWVTLGAVLGHGCCTGVAVIGGRAIAGRVSLKVVTVGGALAFLVFGFIYFIEAFYS